MNKNVLIIGSGGREHALAWKLAQSPRIGKLFVAPGNGGTRQVAENVGIDAIDIDGLIHFATSNEIGLTVVGPDDPLALGVVDAFQARGLRIFGPTRAAAEIESSKAFAKNLMSEAGIPTATFQIFSDYDKALEYVRERGAPIVVKASGLALGKEFTFARRLLKRKPRLRKSCLIMFTGTRVRKWSLRNFLMDKKFPFMRFATARLTFCCRPRKTTNRYATATKARTPAAWEQSLLSRG